uniref:Hemicentin-1 n=1 Tax=Cacopsylla melanoneura TaxID=428564 RepID=A0A8D8RUI3_9HEMI
MHFIKLFLILYLFNRVQCYVKVVAHNGTDLQQLDENFNEVEFYINNKYLNKSDQNEYRVLKRLENKSGSPKKSKNNKKCLKGSRADCSKKSKTKDKLDSRPPDIQIETLPFQPEDDLGKLLPNVTFFNTTEMTENITDVLSGEVKNLTMQNDQLPSHASYREMFGEKVGTASLTFVFDATGSMWDDLTQVRSGATKILQSMLERSNKPIYNFVLVPFRDPEVGPVTVTKNHRVFLEKLQEIYPHGGGDCPENTLTALKEAVENSEPGSYIYVFTDASASDYDLYNKVSTLIQSKQCQVNFVMTGMCGENPNPGYTVFHKIASTSSGVVFHLNKTDVDEVLDFVRLSLSSQKVNLLTVDSPNPTRYPEKHPLPVDGTLTTFTISVSGKRPTVDVYNPRGFYSNNNVTQLLDLPNVKIITVQDPEPGVWTVQVTSDSGHSVRGSGRSSTDFVHGFSTEPTTNIRNTYHRPLKGANNSILVQTTEDGESTKLSAVEVTAINGTVLATVLLKPSPNNKTVYSGGPFVPFDDPCFYAIKGFKYDNSSKAYPFKRISPTAFSPQLPEKPQIEMIPEQIESIGSSAVLRCSVKSLIPFKLRWFKDGITKSKNLHFDQSADVDFPISNVTLSHGGNYTCRANSIAGLESKSVLLHVKGLPPKVKADRSVSSVEGQSVKLNCFVTSNLPYSSTWVRVRSSFSSANSQALIKDPRFILIETNNLLISQVQVTDQGWYLCKANNTAGESSDKVLLNVLKRPSVQVTPDRRDFNKSEDLVISCFVLGGIPAPNLVWKKDGQIITQLKQDPYFKNELDLHIIEAEKTDAGVYECQATNEVGVRIDFRFQILHPELC